MSSSHTRFKLTEHFQSLVGMYTFGVAQIVLLMLEVVFYSAKIL